MGNIIDISSRLKSRNSSENTEHSELTQVVDMTDRREEQIQEERREVKRTILTEFIGASIVVPGRGLQKVALFDIADGGIAFDVEEDLGKFSIGDEVAMRVYLNKYTYFPFVIKISNIRYEDGAYRHGANFIKDSINDVALHHFVKFIETVSANLRRDKGDVMVSNLTR